MFDADAVWVVYWCKCRKPVQLECTIHNWREGNVGMSNIIVRENESLDSALRRFKRSCAKAGIQQEIRKREHYEKPSVRRKKKSEAARKRKYN